MTYYIKENFYFDIDPFNQLRITGPQNHLLLGLSIPLGISLNIIDYEMDGSQLLIKARLNSKSLETTPPVVTDIRTIRGYTEGTRPQPTYQELVEKDTKDVLPQSIKKIKGKDYITLKFTNTYEDERGKKRLYGARIIVPKSYKVEVDNKKLLIEAQEPIALNIKTLTNISLPRGYKKMSFTPLKHKSEKFLSPFLFSLYEKSAQNIEHLVKAHKTSSFEYGTIFPRDWIESADLGEDDLNAETIDYMYSQAMANVSETGEGWHEDLVGSYKRMFFEKRPIIDRKMIDIEPRYIMGIPRITKRFLLKKENRRKLKLIANYVLRNAAENDLITFKKVPYSKKNEYYNVGNWRDSGNAFVNQKPPLSPYDVNCVFYPIALKLIRSYHNFFQIKDLNWLNELINKWEQNKVKYRMYHSHDTIGYALALHGSKNKPLPVSHLDESYDLFYGQPSLEEVVSFAVKLSDPDFFYTPRGPILVANDEEHYLTSQYHGKVIWPKQAAYSVAGLGKQYRYGVENSWPSNLLETIKDVIVTTCEALFKGWEELGSVPELYYYDVKLGKARFYTDQEDYEGQMSMVQLWSSVGARRIIREYEYIMSL